MRKGLGLLPVILTATVAIISFGLLGCEAENVGPTEPTVNYLPQNFSLAIADGSASADGFAHNGVAVVTLDWNNETPGPNTVGPIYIYREKDYGYPHIDGGFSNSDDIVWAQAPWTTLTLQNMYGNGGVTQVKIKSVYTYVNPPRIWFLLQWNDAPDLRQNENAGYWNNAYECQEDGGGVANWQYRYDWNEDWVAFMWDTWNRRYTDLDGDGEVTDREFVFESKTAGFQDNGCAVTCHEEETNPHHTNGANEVCDVWIWTGTRTNFTANQLTWNSGVNDPAFLLDLVLDSTGFSRGDSATIQDPSDDWLTYDDGLAGYAANLDSFGGHLYMDTTDPGANKPYLWLGEGAVTEFKPSLQGWSAGDRVASYLHRTALGGCTDVLGHASYDTGNGTWTLEIERNIGATYDEVENSEDVFLGIFEAHPDQ